MLFVNVRCAEPLPALDLASLPTDLVAGFDDPIEQALVVPLGVIMNNEFPNRPAEGTRTEKVVFAPSSTLRHFDISPEDQRDLRSIQPFVLTSDDLPKYNIQYQGRQKVDELDAKIKI